MERLEIIEGYNCQDLKTLVNDRIKELDAFGKYVTIGVFQAVNHLGLNRTKYLQQLIIKNKL